MVFTTLVLVVLCVVATHADDTSESCLCVNDDLSVWEFFKSLSVDVPEDQQGYYAVYPGELSPLTECNCDRKKRKALGEDTKAASPKLHLSPEAETPVEYIGEVTGTELERGMCPKGKVKFGKECIDEDVDY